MSGLAQVGALRNQNGRIRIDDTGRTFIGTATIEATLAPRLSWQVGGGLEGGYGKATHPSLAKDAQEKHAAAFAQATATYGPLALYSALRQDVYLRAAAGGTESAARRQRSPAAQSARQGLARACIQGTYIQRPVLAAKR